jgi:hypothetical protein
MIGLSALFPFSNAKINHTKFIDNNKIRNGSTDDGGYFLSDDLSENKNYECKNIQKKIFIKKNFFHLLDIIIMNKKIYFKHTVFLKRLTAYHLTLILFFNG